MAETGTAVVDDVVEDVVDEVVEPTDEDIATVEASDEPTDTTDDEELSSETIEASKLAKYVDKFGAVNGVKYIQEGMSFEDALSAELDSANTKLATRETDRGEPGPVDEYAGGDTDGGIAAKKAAMSRRNGGGLPIRISGSQGIVSSN